MAEGAVARGAAGTRGRPAASTAPTWQQALGSDRQGGEDVVVRMIAGFHPDEVGDWVAELSCLHTQHVRHRPPFQERPWVLDPDQRRARVGSEIDCPLCDRAEMPEGLRLLRTAGPWDEAAVPAGLRRSHRTAAGVWGLLQVVDGSVAFRLATTPVQDTLLGAGAAQPIPPEVAHEVRIVGPTRLAVQFWGLMDR